MRKFLNYGRVFYHWRLKRSTQLPYLPEDISIELTNTCNFRCAFCPQSDPEHFNIVTRSTLAPAEAEVLISKLRRGGVETDVLHWTLDGEPFVNREIGEICEVAIRHDFRNFIFSTNGFFCTPERLRELPRNAAYQLCIDFCADEALFEEHRGTRNSWRKVLGNIRDVLADESLDHIELKVTDISSFDPAGAQPGADPVAALKQLLPGSRRLRIGSRIFHNATGHVDGVRERKQASAQRYNLCPYPWTSLVIASNGEVVACCRDLQHKTVLGNLFEQELDEIWNSQAYQALRLALKEERPGCAAACANCDMPFDAGKFKLSHLARTAVNRLGILR